jgi:hypothetical protein
MVLINVVLVLSCLISHPLHVSVAEIEYDEKEKELEIMMRIFVDDLENAIRLHQRKGDLDVLNPPSGTSTDNLISSYVHNHFKIALDGKDQAIRYLGQEIEGEALVCYLLVSNVKKWSTIEVGNSILCELFDDQSNLVHVTIGDKVKSMRLVRDKPTGRLSFESK